MPPVEHYVCFQVAAPPPLDTTWSPLADAAGGTWYVQRQPRPFRPNPSAPLHQRLAGTRGAYRISEVYAHDLTDLAEQLAHGVRAAPPEVTAEQLRGVLGDGGTACQ